MADRQIVLGQLQGLVEDRGLEYVSVRIPGGEAKLSPDAFPALEWIERNAGRWVLVIREAGKTVIKLLAGPPAHVLKPRRENEKGESLMECALCGETIAVYGPEDMEDSTILGTFVDALFSHLNTDHPEELERIGRELS